LGLEHETGFSFYIIIISIAATHVIESFVGFQLAGPGAVSCTISMSPVKATGAGMPSLLVIMKIFVRPTGRSMMTEHLLSHMVQNPKV
jgi:hypothetical protein